VRERLIDIFSDRSTIAPLVKGSKVDLMPDAGIDVCW